MHDYMVSKRREETSLKEFYKNTIHRLSHFPFFDYECFSCRECYLRFCSQQFDLTNNNEAVHLSNNAIQCKYLNGERSGELPEENMWDVHQFKDYLRWVPAARRMRTLAVRQY